MFLGRGMVFKLVPLEWGEHMNDFKIIYKILRLLDKHKGDESFDYQLISASAMKISFAEWEQILIELQVNGYIRGLVYTQTPSDKFPHLVEPIRPQITLAGMEFLAENGMMAKAKEALSMIGEIIP